jgi:hypothetical protein
LKVTRTWIRTFCLPFFASIAVFTTTSLRSTLPSSRILPYGNRGLNPSTVISKGTNGATLELLQSHVTQKAAPPGHHLLHRW